MTARAPDRSDRGTIRLRCDPVPYRYVVTAYPFGISCGILICRHQKDT